MGGRNGRLRPGWVAHDHLRAPIDAGRTFLRGSARRLAAPFARSALPAPVGLQTDVAMSLTAGPTLARASSRSGMTLVYPTGSLAGKGRPGTSSPRHAARSVGATLSSGGASCVATRSRRASDPCAAVTLRTNTATIHGQRMSRMATAFAFGRNVEARRVAGSFPTRGSRRRRVRAGRRRRQLAAVRTTGCSACASRQSVAPSPTRCRSVRTGRDSA